VASRELTGRRSPRPHGPLCGNELAQAIEFLTDRQLRAYQHRREGHAWNWIAQRMGVSRQAAMQLVVKAEKRLGYEPSVTPKKKARYKPAAQRRADEGDRWVSRWLTFIDELDPLDRVYINRIARDTTLDDLEAERRILKRLRHLSRTYGFGPDGDDDRDELPELDWARHRGDAYDWAMDELGVAASDLVLDDGKGYDRL
jgi:hypothetical protein